MEKVNGSKMLLNLGISAFSRFLLAFFKGNATMTQRLFKSRAELAMVLERKAIVKYKKKRAVRTL